MFLQGLALESYNRAMKSEEEALKGLSEVVVR
jgi:hypothetical protein